MTYLVAYGEGDNRTWIKAVDWDVAVKLCEDHMCDSEIYISWHEYEKLGKELDTLKRAINKFKNELYNIDTAVYKRG